MVGHRSAGMLVLGIAVSFAIGCGNQPARVLLPHDDGEPTSKIKSDLAGPEGPRLCFFDEFFNYCYPGGSYCPCPEAEIPFEVGAGRTVSIHWFANPSPGTKIRWYRWALDIEDVTDQTPRVDENTDLGRWSRRSAEVRSAELGPWSNGEVHRLYVEVEDDQGLRSLGIVRFEVGKIENRPPVCDNATADPPALWPPNNQLVPVSIAGVLDPDGDPVEITVQRVTQDEPVRNCPNAVIGPDGGVELKAERSGRGNGRLYTIWFTATDPSGGSCDGSVQVCVPHDRNRPTCIDDGQSFDSLAPCPRDRRGGGIGLPRAAPIVGNTRETSDSRH